MDNPKKSATLPTGMAPPTAGAPRKSPKLSSHSFSGGFLSRLKRRFRLKSKGYELHPGSQTTVEGVRFQRHSENLSELRQKEENVRQRAPRSVDIARTHSDIRTERPPQFRGGIRKGEEWSKSGVVGGPESVVQRNYLGAEVSIQNDFLASDNNVIDLENDGACGIGKDVFNDIDPGYETLDEVRRKMQIKFHQTEMNGSARLNGSEVTCHQPKGPQHRRSQSTGHTSGQYASNNDFCPMRDSGLGSPLVSEISSSIRTSEMTTRESLSMVSNTDISAYHSVDSLGCTQSGNFLNTSNLTSMRMNSCPGKTSDMTPEGSTDFLGVGNGGMPAYNSDMFLGQGDSLEVSELYANPKIIMRKKSQREENEEKEQLSAHDSDKTLSNTSDEGNPNFDTSKDNQRSGTLDSKVNKIDQGEVVPPIPERKYSLYLNQQNKRQNSQENYGGKISEDSNSNSAVTESQHEDYQVHGPACTGVNTAVDISSLSDQRGLTDSTITDSVSSRFLNQSVETVGQDSGFWFSEDDDLGRSYNVSTSGDESLNQKVSKGSPANLHEIDERVILTGDVRTILAPEQNVLPHTDIEAEDGDGRETTVFSKGGKNYASDQNQVEVKDFSKDNGHVQKINSSGIKIPYKEMTVCHSVSLGKEQTFSENQSFSTEPKCDKVTKESVHRKSKGEREDSGSTQNSALVTHIINDENHLSQTNSTNYHTELQDSHQNFSRSKDLICDKRPSPVRPSPDLESDGVVRSPHEKDFESSLESTSIGGSTDPSMDSLGGSTDGLSDKSGDPHVMSYEDNADAVLENLDVQSDSFVDEVAVSLAGSLDVQCNTDSKESILDEVSNSTDYELPSDISETLKVDSTEQELESTSDPSDDKMSSASTLSPSARLPDYYYQDTEPVHMSLSELGMSEEQWVEPEPIHMSVNELKRSKSHYEGQRHSHFHTPSPSLWQSPPDSLNDSNNSHLTSGPFSLPPTRPCANVYATVDDDDNDDEPSDVLTSVNMRHQGQSVMQAANSTLGARPRRPYSAEVPSLHMRRDDDFMRRLDSRPPAIIPRSNPEEETQKDFMESMRQLKDCGWYWGPLSWDEAEIKLMNKPDGSFLVRDSSDDRYILSLSFNMQGRVHHTRIEHHKGKFSFWSQPDSHGKATIRDFIEQCVKNSRNGQFLYFIRPSGPGSPPMPVHLLHPVSRYKQMQSLQHVCRFQILQKVRRDHIDKLPIPTSIKDYLKDPQYYVEYLEDD